MNPLRKFHKMTIKKISMKNLDGKLVDLTNSQVLLTLNGFNWITGRSTNDIVADGT